MDNNSEEFLKHLENQQSSPELILKDIQLSDFNFKIFLTFFQKNPNFSCIDFTNCAILPSKFPDLAENLIKNAKNIQKLILSGNNMNKNIENLMSFVKIALF